MVNLWNLSLPASGFYDHDISYGSVLRAKPYLSVFYVMMAQIHDFIWELREGVYMWCSRMNSNEIVEDEMNTRLVWYQSFQLNQ